MPVLIRRFLPGFKITYVNKTYCNYFDKTPEELIGKTFLSLILEDDRETVIASISSLSITKPIQSLEHRIIAPDGDIKWQRWTNRALFDSEGQVIAYQSFGEDITERKRSEEKAKRFGYILENSLNEIYIFDAETFHFVEVNFGARKNLGYSIEELYGLTPLDLKPEFTAESFAELVEPLRNGDREMVQFTSLHRRKNGSLYPVEVYLQLMLSDDPVFVAIILDITDHKQAEEALRKSEQHYRLLADNVTDVIWTADINLRFTYISPSVEYLLGFTAEEQLPKDFKEIIAPDSYHLAMKVFAEELAIEETDDKDLNRSRTLEVEQFCEDGSTTWTEEKLTFLRDKNDRAVGILGVTRDITERKQADEALRESEMRFRSFSAASFEGIAVTQKGNFLDVNDRFLSICGYNRQEILGMGIDDIVHSEDKKIVWDHILSGYELSYEHRIVHKDGRIIHLEICGKPIQYKGKPCRITAIRDITERKRAEEALRDSQTHLEKAQEVAHIGSWEHNLLTDVLWWTKEIFQIFGINADDFDGNVETFFAFVHPDDLESVKETIQAAITGDAPYRVEHRIVRPNGELRWVYEQAEIVRDKNGSPLKMIGTVQDIMERKRAEEALKDSEALYSSLVENLSQNIIRKDLEGKFTFVNNRFCEMLDKPRMEIIGKTDYDFFPKELAEKYQSDDRKVIETGQLFESVEEHISPNREKIYVQVAKTPIFDYAGETIGIQCVFWDITERKQTEEELASFNRGMVGREERILEMKRKVNALSAELGRGSVYDEAPGADDEVEDRKNREEEPEHITSKEDIEIKDVLDVKALEHVLKSFCDSVGIASAIIDLDGNALVKTNWQRICTDFHRVNEETCRRCIESDTSIANQLKERKEYAIYKCRNGMMDAASPIMIMGRHVANAFIGQFHTSEPDEGLFHAQAVEFGFDDEDYIRALHEAPVIPNEKLPPILDFLTSIAEVSAIMGLERLQVEKTMRSLQQKQEDLKSQRKAALNLLEDTRRAEEALRESEERFRTLVEQSPMAVEIYETNGRLLSVNDTWVEFWDLEKETVVDFNILDDPECERTGLASAFKEAQQGRMRILHDVLYDAEASGLTGGRKRWISSKMYPILDQEREVKNIILTYDDITERKNLEEQLRQSQKMEAIGQLSGGVAHDFNNLLTGIIGNLSLAEMKAPIEIQDFLINAKKATSRAGELVRKLLAFSRKSQIELKPVDLNQTTKDTFHLARQTIDRRIDMDLQISEEHLHILGDDAQVNSLIMNLLLNARDAITEVMDEERGGDTFVITVRTYIQPGEVYAVISVSDTGIGMDKETQEHIFEPFYTTKEIGKGTGLGLTSVYGIVKQHDGRIEIESELGEGTTFKVYLPIAKEKVSTTEEEPGEISRGTETILIIDDEAMIRDLGKNILEQWGYTVLLASEGQEGLNVFHQNQERIDLVILDLSMPKMSGREVLAQIHAVSPEAKVAISSGYSPEGIEKEELERRGATGFLSKPYKLFEMLRTVRNLLDEPRS